VDDEIRLSQIWTPAAVKSSREKPFGEKSKATWRPLPPPPRFTDGMGRARRIKAKPALRVVHLLLVVA
jgi:hypothetical protein